MQLEKTEYFVFRGISNNWFPSNPFNNYFAKFAIFNSPSDFARENIVITITKNVDYKRTHGSHLFNRSNQK